MFFLLFYILNPFLWHISLNKSRLISAIFVLRKSYRGIITMHISIYPIFHRATSHLYVHVIVSACWFDHVMFTWGSRRYWCEIPFFRLFLKFVFHRVNSKNLGEKDLEINHLEMIRKKKVCKLSFYFNHRLRYFLVVIYVTVLILYITLCVMISGLHQVFMQSKKIFSIPSRLVVALKFIILTNGLFPY